MAVEGKVHTGCFSLLESTRVGCISTKRKFLEERDEEEEEEQEAGAGDEVEERGPGPPDF